VPGQGVRGQIILPAISAIFECANCSPRVCPRFWPTCSLCQPNGPSTIAAAPFRPPLTPPLLANSSHHIFGSWQITYTPSLKIVCIAWEKDWVGLGRPYSYYAASAFQFQLFGRLLCRRCFGNKRAARFNFLCPLPVHPRLPKECTIIATLKLHLFTNIHGGEKQNEY